ncbi:hypothetical protein [uncultured Jannaschia sp.]|uniref:hypothetical protein n=1 Tax=uncultured Jannaschia sp. TaxID=293347 RepID=UPI0026186F92|nr:hypothetical protein [uncultured Jannaschia sp.]
MTGAEELEESQDLPAALLRFRHGSRPLQEYPELGYFVRRNVLDHGYREMPEMQCLEFPCWKFEGGLETARRAAPRLAVRSDGPFGNVVVRLPCGGGSVAGPTIAFSQKGAAILGNGTEAVGGTDGMAKRDAEKIAWSSILKNGQGAGHALKPQQLEFRSIDVKRRAE